MNDIEKDKYYFYNSYHPGEINKIVYAGKSVIKAIKKYQFYLEGLDIKSKFIYIGYEKLIKEVNIKDDPECFL